MTIETKYNIGDEVWAIVENRAQCLRIESIAVSTYAETFDESGALVSYRIRINYYLGDGVWINDVDCFPTKEELLKSL
jgi:hypothetical protein